VNNDINYYLDEFRTVFEGEPWYGKSLMSVVNEADTTKVFSKPNPSSHTAYEILEHIYVWRDLFLKRLKGDHGSKISINSPEDWSKNNPGNVAAWNDLIEKLRNNQRQLLAALATFKNEDLDKQFASTKYSLRVFCNGHIQHDIYHIGQIALALKYS
jgi:uncharacterized damage-inducible protein DinB